MGIWPEDILNALMPRLCSLNIRLLYPFEVMASPFIGSFGLASIFIYFRYIIL